MAGHPASLLLSSSFRRKPESSVFALARHSSASWNPAFAVAFDSALTASLRFSARIRASGSLSLACARESNQREHTPEAAPSALRAAGAQGQAGVRSMGILPIRELARIPARDPAGDSGLPSPRQTGPRIQSNGQSKSGFALSFASARRTRALCSSRGPMALRRQRTIRPRRGAREGSRAFRCCTGCAISGTRPLTRTVRAGARTAQGAGACFFGSFLCTSKERNPLA